MRRYRVTAMVPVVVEVDADTTERAELRARNALTNLGVAFTPFGIAMPCASKATLGALTQVSPSVEMASAGASFDAEGNEPAEES